VKEYFSVDIISASETEVTFTIDGSKNITQKLDTLSERLRIECNIHKDTKMEFVEYEMDRALVFCIGQHMRNNVGLLARASTILSENNINIELVSQGRLQRAMVFGVD
jgi:aspartokinase